MTDPQQQHGDPVAVDVFAHAVAPNLNAAGAQYQHGPMGGHEWRWHTDTGVWVLNVGGAIDAGPLVMGPYGNRWHMAEYTLRHAHLVILMLQLAGALVGPEDRQLPPAPAAGRAIAPRPPVVPVISAVPVAPRQHPAPTAAPAPVVPLVAGSDLPARDSGAYPTTRGPRPYPTARGAGPGAAYVPQPVDERPADLRALTDRLYQERPTVMGGGGPAEYGSDGQRYEGDRIIPARPDYAPPPSGWRPSGAVAAHFDGQPGPGESEVGPDDQEGPGE